MISFYILTKRFLLTLEGLSDASVALITKNKIVLQYIYYKDS